MSPEEERWIKIILEEEQNAEMAEPTLDESRLTETARAHRAQSRRHRQPPGIGAEYIIERSGKHRTTVL